MERAGQEDHGLCKRSQRQRQVPLLLGEVLRAALQFGPCYHAGEHPGTVECHPHGAQLFPVLQHFRTHDRYLYQGNKSS